MSYYINKHLEVLRKEDYSRSTIRERGRCLRRLHGDLPEGILCASQEQLQTWLAGPQDHRRWSRWTKCTYTGHVLAFYPWLIEYLRNDGKGHLLIDDPTAGIRRPKAPRGVPRPATQAQLAIALSAPEPLRTAVLLAAYGGLRRAEAAASQREHITEELILIPVAKGGDAQTVPTHPLVWEHIRERPDGPLVGMTAEHLGQYALRWFRRQGLWGFGLHKLRHWYGTMIQRELGDLRVTQECMRHRDPKTTAVYTQVTPAQRGKAVALLPVVNPSRMVAGSDPSAA